MYSNCIFCHAGLGANEVIEHFPVGHRLAFDGAKGRLWVVCRRCERWNLTPLEERWEAIEDCERAFRATTLRVLRALETAWRNAEEIAAIADNLHFGFGGG